MASSWMPVVEVALLATSLPETAGGCHIVVTLAQLLAISTVTALNGKKLLRKQCETIPT